MIVTITDDGQYFVPEEKKETFLEKLSKINLQLIEMLEYEHTKEGDFKKLYIKLFQTVRQNGIRLPKTPLRVSDLVLPPENLSLKDLRKIFAETISF